MIDPSSSEEEGEDDPVANLTSKGRVTNAPKGTSAVCIIGGSSGSVVGSNIPTSGSNSDLVGNLRQSNISSIGNRNDVGSISVAGPGATSHKNEQIYGSRADTGNLEVPSNGIPSGISQETFNQSYGVFKGQFIAKAIITVAFSIQRKT
ncbi:uncharacterized protein Dere_GG16412 [Drosophila erecta]|uniref:Uncharacterized protein n=1 Tax=Drosophila erecta TaxID=7220 RepID=B3P9N4_DROER|nr:uncharacterized protein Dere_GG16412 [Drosophila erecta]